jgi:hypothetical protein
LQPQLRIGILADDFGDVEKKPKESTKTPSAAKKRTGSHITDMTDQFVGKSLIITGAAPPKKPLTPAEREEALRKTMETATEKPPEK